MAPTSVIAGAVAIGLSFYAVAGVLLIAVANLRPPSGATEEDLFLARYHAIMVSYTAGWRKIGLTLALAAYAAAAIDLFQADATALFWLCLAVGVDCGVFLTWRDRRVFVATLSPEERTSDAAGVAALGLALMVTAILRFSGALA
jgi:hypothetical protein